MNGYLHPGGKARLVDEAGSPALTTENTEARWRTDETRAPDGERQLRLTRSRGGTEGRFGHRNDRNTPATDREHLSVEV